MDEKLLIYLTLAELKEALFSEFKEALLDTLNKVQFQTHHKCCQEKLVYGLDGLSMLLNCSKATAYRIKKSGKLDPAISRYGRILVFDTELVLQILKIEKHEL